MIEKITENETTIEILKKQLEEIKQKVLVQESTNKTMTDFFEPNVLDLYMKDTRIDHELTMEEEIMLARIKDIASEALLTCESENGNLTKEEREGLEQLISLGYSAVEIFVLTNQGLVISVARKYKGMNPEDLIQEGNIGLLTAIQKFDYTRGCRFSTHATWWIKAHVYRAYAQQRFAIRLPMHIYLKTRSYLYTTENLCRKLNRIPTDEEISQELGVSRKEAKFLKNSIYFMTSLNTPINGRDDETIEETIPTDSRITEKIALNNLYMENILDLIVNLPSKWSQILLMRFGLLDGKLYSRVEIAKEIGEHTSNIRRIEKYAIDSIKNQIDQKKRRV